MNLELSLAVIISKNYVGPNGNKCGSRILLDFVQGVYLVIPAWWLEAPFHLHFWEKNSLGQGRSNGSIVSATTLASTDFSMSCSKVPLHHAFYDSTAVPGGETPCSCRVHKREREARKNHEVTNDDYPLCTYLLQLTPTDQSQSFVTLVNSWFFLTSLEKIYELTTT